MGSLKDYSYDSPLKTFTIAMDLLFPEFDSEAKGEDKEETKEVENGETK